MRPGVLAAAMDLRYIFCEKQVRITSFAEFKRSSEAKISVDANERHCRMSQHPI